MFSNYKFKVKDFFLQYVKIDSESDVNSKTSPSTYKQKDVSNLLVEQLLQMGLTDAECDEFGIVYATLPSNSDKKVPTLCFCAHVDTTADCSGANVKPRVIENYQGQVIDYPDDKSLFLSPDEHKNLNNKIGHDIVVASGKTLLGSDDKSGVAVIMDAIHFLSTNNNIKHGTIKILFTPDEEIGRGTENVNMNKLSADFGYTLDSGDVGWFENETFSANGALITIQGKSIHPGYAKGQMINSQRIAAFILNELTIDSDAPESTEGLEGFLHCVNTKGSVEKTEMNFIIRAFDDEELLRLENKLKQVCNAAIQKFGTNIDVKIIEQYRNMKKILDKYPEVTQYAHEAIQRSQLQVVQKPIRGGTDGSKLSFMGLPCPNLFAGEQAIHSRVEWCSVQDMEKAVETVVHLCCIWEENA